MGSCFLIPNLAQAPSPSLASATTTTVPRRALFNAYPRRGEMRGSRVGASAIPNANSYALAFHAYPRRSEMRGSRVAASAILNANSYALAFLLPASLFAVTVFASIRLADKLDDDFIRNYTSTQSKPP